MEAVRRVVIHDKHPVLGPELVTRPLNLFVLIVAAATLAIQALALVQVLTGAGTATGVAGDKAGAADHVAFAIVALLWVCLGIVVFLQRRARFTGQFFLLAACAGATFLALGTLYSASLADALTFAVALLLLPALLLEFARFADEDRDWRSPELLLFTPPAVLAWPVARHLQNTHADILLWQIALVLVATYLIAAVIQTWHDVIRARTPDRAAESRVRLLGLGVGTATAIPLFIVPLIVGGHLETVLTWLPLIALIFLIAMAWATLIFEFDHAELLVRRSLVFSLLAVAVACVYGAIGFVLVNAGPRLVALGGLAELAIAALIVGAGFVPIQRGARRVAGWLIYGARSDRLRLLQNLSRRLDRVMSPDLLVETLVTELTDALHLRGAAFFRYSMEGSFRLVAATGDASALPGTIDVTAADALGHPPAPLLLTHAKPLTPGRSQTVAPDLRVLDQLHSMLTVPLVIRTHVEALLCLQPKLAHDTFDADDLALLAPVMSQASSALDNALLVHQLTENVTELQAAYLRITHEQEAERSRLARELHDGITQELAAVITLVAVLERQVGRRDPDASVTLDRLRQQAQIAYEGVRDASHGLLPPILVNQGLVPALHALLDSFESSEGITVERQLCDACSLSDDAQLALYRVAQESLENVRKHSGSATVAISLDASPTHMTLTIADQGAGFPSDRSSGLGIIAMEQRLRAIGGHLRVESAPGNGVKIIADVPEGTQSAPLQSA